MRLPRADEQIKRFRFDAPPPKRPPAAAPLPGIASSIAAAGQRYPAGPTEFGFLYPQIQALDTNLQTAAQLGLPNTFTAAHTLAIPITTNPTGPGGNLTLAFSQAQAAPSGIRGVTLDRPAGEQTPHGIDYSIAGVHYWGGGMDFDASTPANTDYVPLYSYVAQADVFRFSHRAALSGGIKFIIGQSVGTPAAQGSCGVIQAAAGVGGLELRTNGAANTLTLTQSAAGSDFGTLNFNNKLQLAFDLAGNQTDEFRLVDTNAAHTGPSSNGYKNRLYVTFPNTDAGAVGLNCTDPQSLLEVRGSNAAALFNVAQSYFTGCYASGGIANRSINIQTILDASEVATLIWLKGTLGSTSTRATPTSTSSSTAAHALLDDGTALHLVSAPAGTNQTLSKLISIGSNTLGFNAATPVAKQTGASAAGIAAITDANARAAITALQNALAAYGLVTAPA